MTLEDSLALRLLAYLAGKYRPVSSEWVDAPELAAALAVPEPEVEARCRDLLAAQLIEYSPADEENTHSAALITVKGLLAIGRVP